MGHIFGRSTRTKLPTVASGSGCYLYDTNGKQYLDGSGGAAVSSLGHNDPEITSAIKAQLDKVAYAHTSFFTSEPAEELAARIAKATAGNLDRVYLVSGGSEAIETAIKLGRQYFIEKGEAKRSKLIARRQSYHGNTLGALAVGGNQWRRAPFEPLLLNHSHISPCYEYREKADDENLFDYGQRVANELKEEVERLGPETVMGFMAETVVGATGGAIPAVDSYFKRIREICDEFGILLILDEVMCGMGRTGTLFAYEQEGIVPDIVVIAKGLGGGYQPIGATICSQKIYNTIDAGSGAFMHGHTYMGHPIAAAAANAVLSAIEKRKLLENVNDMSAKLMTALNLEFGQHPHVGDIRGRGLFIGLELVKDRTNKSPFLSKEKLAARIKASAFDHGLICYPMSGTVDGKCGDHILLAPPFIISEEQIEELVSKLSLSLKETLKISSTALG